MNIATLFGDDFDKPKKIPRNQEPLSDSWTKKWGVADVMGELKLLPKGALTIDYGYQRTQVSGSRVLVIARNFQWLAFGALVVVLRANGDYVIVDGQHRWLATLKRSDVDLVPCVVFVASGQRVEAKAFGAINAMRGAVRSIERFKASLVAEDPAALKVAKLVLDAGYQVRESKAAKTIGCVQFLVQLVQRCDAEQAESIWKACVSLHRDAHINLDILKGMELIAKDAWKHGKPFHQFVSGLCTRSFDDILDSIAKAKGFFGSSGAGACAEGLIRVHDYKRRPSNRWYIGPKPREGDGPPEQ